MIITLRQNPRAFVDRLDFITSFGHGDGAGHRDRLGLRGGGPSVVITDLCIMHPDPDTAELVVTSLHPGVSAAQVEAATGWPIRFAADVSTTPVPDDDELQLLRALTAA